MQVYNTMTRKKEELVPLTPGVIRMYVCGPTVYNFFHIGNARPFVVFDTLRRYLEYKGYRVVFAQNFTDIDDKLISRANAEGTTVSGIAERYIKEYYADADALSIERATANPRATEHVDEIISLVQTLVARGHAYAADNGDVYFSVRSYPEYGKLSGQSIDDLESGARIDPTEHKRDPLDFAVWKGAKPGEPSWDSPWGKGRPGWHIECSAMSMHILGETFDIHAGGQDLVFPHHENEIAQSEAATGKPFARYWMHNGYININNEKMSKSLGNFLLVRDIAKEFDLEAVRLFLLGAQYRNPVNFSRELVEQADAALSRIRTARERLDDALAKPADAPAPEDAAFLASVPEFRARWEEAMDDDLNTADALGVLFDFTRAVNSFVSAPRGRGALEAADAFMKDACHVMGLLQHKSDEAFPREALALLERRKAARAAKDWAAADAIRDELKALGFAVEDGKDGAKLKRL
ncbi:MAG: Cysteine--tRNA ligase [Firmicutes bacterium ADurb.Bin248]|nr:MAG: Cysteine--tRNA ligase [Firmicutes bacterium ADurb.Bin248]HPK14786.1 cysteine--tRNA ligase [Clostridia bacterium]